MARRKDSPKLASTPSIGEEVLLTSPDDPTDSYFAAAYNLLRVARQVDGPLGTLQMQQHVLLACISAFLCLEAAINRLYYDCFDAPTSDALPFHSATPAPLLSHIREAWPRFSVREKFVLLPSIAASGAFEFVTTEEPFTFFDEFVRFRNRLVHPKMSEYTTKIKVMKVEVPREGRSASWGGDVLARNSLAPARKAMFPRTELATTFADLQVKDAEVSLEIAFRMRMVLFEHMVAAPPMLMYSNPEGILQVKIGENVADLLTLHLGNRPRGISTKRKPSITSKKGRRERRLTSR